MLRVFLITLSPLISLAVFNLGSSFLTTLLTIRLQLASQSGFFIGLLSSVFFLGYVLGTYYTQKFILRVGHIRAYSFFTASIAVTSMLHGLLIDSFSWLVLRLLTGFCIGAIWIVIESWLLTLSTPKTQGQVLSLYMIFFYGSQSLAQLLLNIGDISSLVPFCLITIATCISILPLAFTRIASPHFAEHTPLSPLKLLKTSPLGVIGCFTGGMILSVIIGILPANLKDMDISLKDVSYIMTILVLGGTLLQYPIGKISDIWNRRLVLIGLALSTAILSILLTIFSFNTPYLFYALIFIFGGAIFTIYPLCISFTYDFVSPSAVVSTAGGLLLAYSSGAIIGPLISPIFVKALGSSGTFIYITLCGGFLGLFGIWRAQKSTPLAVSDQENFIATPLPSPIAIGELDPRIQDTSEFEEHVHEKNQDDDL